MPSTAWAMNNVQQKIRQLEESGWTLAAIADELGNHVNTLEKWKAGHRYPANTASVLLALGGLTKKKRVPKKRRYGKMRAARRDHP